MRFMIGTATLDPALLVPLARAAEEAGYDVVKVPDSICYPEVSDSTYPYNATGSREFLDGKPFLDPFTAIAAMGAATSRIRFVTSVLKLPMRHPVLVAKQVSSVAALTGDRVSLGVGSSPWPDDYEVLDIPMERRGRRMDESIDIVKGLTAGGYFAYQGEIFDLPSIKIDPVPARPIPVLIGGHAEASLRRAARVADGWIAAGSGRDDLARMLATIEALRKDAGRDDVPFEVHIGVQDDDPPDELRRLEDLGVTHVGVNFTDRYADAHDERSVAQRADAMQRYADDVIAQFR